MTHLVQKNGIPNEVIWFAKEHSTYESSQFVDVIIKKFPFKIKDKTIYTKKKWKSGKKSQKRPRKILL